MPDSTLSRRRAALLRVDLGNSCFTRHINFPRKLQKNLPFDFIFLTGSVGAGKAVMKAAAEHLTPVLLELGGQNPAIVDETANLPDAAKKIVWGAMAWGAVVHFTGLCGHS